MSLVGACFLFLLLLLLSALFSGSETGVYCLSRARLGAKAHAGSRTARLLQRLLRDDTGLLITLLVGNNLMLELATHLTESRLDTEVVPPWMREVLIAVVLTPIVFFFGELLPKDLFRRRPNRFLLWITPFLGVARLLFFPITLPLKLLSTLLERATGVQEREFTRALGREEVLEVLALGTSEGLLPPQAEELARNVLVLRETPVRSVMVPWKQVSRVLLDEGEAAIAAKVKESEFSRLPAVGVEAGARKVVGYVHQIDVLREAGSPEGCLRPLPAFPPDLSVDKALGRMRVSGQRIGLVGPPERPLGVVTIMDLLSAISGDLGAA